MSHFPKYMRTGYYRKGTKLLEQAKKGFVDNWEWQLGFVAFGFFSFICLPYTVRNIIKQGPERHQFKTEYLIIRDVDVNMEKLGTYNPDELEAAKQYNKNLL